MRRLKSCICVWNYEFVVVADNGKEILSMNEVLSYMLRSSKMLCEETELSNLLKQGESEWQNYVGAVRGMIVTYPGMVRSCVYSHQLSQCPSLGATHSEVIQGQSDYLAECSLLSILVSAEPFSHGTGTLRCLQKEMATYRH